MKTNKITGLISRLFIVLIMLAFTQVVSADIAEDVEIAKVDAIRYEPPYYEEPDTEYVNTTHDFRVVIGEDNYETATHIIHVINPTNVTMTLNMNANFPYMPKNMVLKVNDKLDDFNIAYESEQYRNVQYQNKYTLAANGEMKFEITYERLVTPNDYDLGLWRLKYYYNNPINLNHELPPGFDYRERRIDFYTNQVYNGEVQFEYSPTDLRCSGCNFDKLKNVAVIDGSRWFNLNWDKKRLPLTSSLVYLVMVGGIFALILKARKKFLK
jgi:hypothetical protein